MKSLLAFITRASLDPNFLNQLSALVKYPHRILIKNSLFALKNFAVPHYFARQRHKEKKTLATRAGKIIFLIETHAQRYRNTEVEDKKNEENARAEKQQQPRSRSMEI
jgi:hypothetical protein